jgi:hypothetical protein
MHDQSGKTENHQTSVVDEAGSRPRIEKKKRGKNEEKQHAYLIRKYCSDGNAKGAFEVNDDSRVWIFVGQFVT